MTSTPGLALTRLLRPADGYAVRHVDGASTHLGVVRRDGRQWVAFGPNGRPVGYPVATRRDAAGFLVMAAEFRAPTV